MFKVQLFYMALFVGENIIYENDVDEDDADDKKRYRESKEILKPFRNAFKKIDLWGILKKSILLYNLDGKK